MFLLITIYLFLLGLAFGSFALAMVDRMKAKKDWVRGRSQCDSCKHSLKPIDLIPVYSWVSKRGKCRYCSVKLSPAYPAVELLGGAVFVLSFVFYPYELSGFNFVLFGLWYLALVIMLALTVFDVRWYLLPNKLVYPLTMVAFVHRIIFTINNDLISFSYLLNLGLTLFISCGVFYLLHIVSSGKWIGDGDVRLGVAMGLFLNGPVEAWLAIFIASIIGVIIGVIMMIKSGKKTLSMKLPYGPMLMAGLIISYLFSSGLIAWYSKTFLFL